MVSKIFFSILTSTLFCPALFAQFADPYELHLPFSLSNAHDIGIGDLDNDNDNDLVLWSSDSLNLMWIENDSAGNFSQIHAVDYPPVTRGDRILIEDLDMDGDNEIITLQSDQTIGSDDTIGIHWNNGNSIFNGVGYAFGAAELFDFDDDGDKDFVGLRNNKTVVWAENIAGQISSAVVLGNISFTGNRKNIAVADLNTDGYYDLVLSHFDILNSYLSVCMNNGNNTFSSVITIETFINQAFEVGLPGTADIDGDGHLDIFYRGSGNKWYKNDGSGTSYTTHLTNSFNYLSGEFYDFNGDGFDDFISSGYLANTNIYFNNGNNTYQQHILSYDGSRALTLGDLDSDGDKDVFLIDDNPGYNLMIYENLFEGTKTVRGKIFYDANYNGVFDGTDLPFRSRKILETTSGSMSFSNITGEYRIPVDTGWLQVEPDPLPFSSWNYSTNATHSLYFADTLLWIDSVDFGLYPDTIMPELEVDVTPGATRCNQVSNTWLQVMNTGTTIASGMIELVLDDSISFISANPLQDSVSGQHIFWHFDSLWFFSALDIQIAVLQPGFLNIGNTFHTLVKVHAKDALGAITNTFSDTATQVWSCAYDPNDKLVEPAGYEEPGFIFSDEELEYTVRFQNTGNDTAIHITIVDQLDPYLDWSTLSLRSGSHPMDANINAYGEFRVRFDSIMLPDSNVNEPASHGYVKFKLRIKNTVPVGYEVKNYANIFFDLNPPILTEPVLNTVVDCNYFRDFIVANATYCDTGSILAESTIPYNHTYAWTLNGSLVGNDSAIHLQNLDTGSYVLNLAISNPLCIADTNYAFAVNPTPSPPIIIPWLNGLSSSEAYNYQWYLDGVPISDATAQFYQPTVNGDFTVETFDSMGCSNISEPYTFMSVGILQQDKYPPPTFTVHPNPFSLYIHLQFNSFPGTDDEIVLWNVLGEQIKTIKTNHTQSIRIYTDNLPCGMYFVCWHRSGHVLASQPLIKH